MISDLVIYGTGGMGREACEYVDAITQDGAGWRLLGFLDPDPTKTGSLVRDLPVLGDAGWLEGRPGVGMIVGVGSPAARWATVNAIRAIGQNPFPVLRHPAARVGNRVVLSEGTIVAPEAVLTTQIEVGRHAIINVGASVAHDGRLGDFTTLAPGARLAGYVQLDEGVDVGIGASVIQCLHVGEWSVVGAGAAVVRNLPSNITAVGVPAKVIKERQPGWHKAGH